MTSKIIHSEQAQLLRFDINLAALPADATVYTLDFPADGIMKNLRDDLLEEINRNSNRKLENLGIPYRQLNNAIMTLCRSLTQGFEWNSQQKCRQAVAVFFPDQVNQLPAPEKLRLIIWKWASWWINTFDFPEIIKGTLRKKYIPEIQKVMTEWAWKSSPAQDVLHSLAPQVWTAIPSLVASLLHSKRSNLPSADGKPVTIRWRKVQEIDGSVSVLGFHEVEGKCLPFRAHWFKTNQFGQPDAGKGWFVYKLEPLLRTQPHKLVDGTDTLKPWLFLSVHAQRYGDGGKLTTKSNRDVSILVGANQARMIIEGNQTVDFPVNSTLLQLSAELKDIEDDAGNKQKVWQWVEELSDLLDAIGLHPDRRLLSPDIILNDLDWSRFWQPERIKQKQDEYYPIHAEGHKYDGSGHDLHPGLSQENVEAVIRAAWQHLPLLNGDQCLMADQEHITKRQFPNAMRKHSEISEKQWSGFSFHEMLTRSLGNDSMQLSILWHTEHTYTALMMKLLELFGVKEAKDIPIPIYTQRVGSDYYDVSVFQNDKYHNAHPKHVRKWKQLLEKLPRHSNHFAIVELYGNEYARQRNYGVIRDACSQCRIVSQMIQPITLKVEDDNPAFRKNDSASYRADSVLREIIYRHTGSMFGTPAEIYSAAKISFAIDQGAKGLPQLDVVAFHLENKQQGVFYPVAVRLNYTGSVETCFPDELTWQPYHHGATALGRFMSDQWRYRSWQGNKPKINDKSPLNLDKNRSAIRRFVHDVLASLKRPTLVVIEGENWKRGDTLPELRDPDLGKTKTFLNIERGDPSLKHIIAIVRLQAGINTPQYLIEDDKRHLLDLTFRMGFIDDTYRELPFYYSIGERLNSTKESHTGEEARAMMHDNIGAGISYRHPQVVEFAPFFVQNDFNSFEKKVALCRVLHYLRVLPAWEHGTPVYPYPLHLAQAMVKDQLAVLALD